MKRLVERAKVESSQCIKAHLRQTCQQLIKVLQIPCLPGEERKRLKTLIERRHHDFVVKPVSICKYTEKIMGEKTTNVKFNF